MRINFRNIPKFLHKSEYYKTILSENGNLDFEIEVIMIPPENEEVRNIEDFKLLFHTYGIWGLNYGTDFLNFIDKERDNVLEFLYSLRDSHDQAKMLIDEILKVYLPKLEFELILGEENVYFSDYDSSKYKKDDDILCNIYYLHIRLRSKYINSKLKPYMVAIIDDGYIFIENDEYNSSSFDGKTEVLLRRLDKCINDISEGIDTKLNFFYDSDLDSFQKYYKKSIQHDIIKIKKNLISIGDMDIYMDKNNIIESIKSLRDQLKRLSKIK